MRIAEGILCGIDELSVVGTQVGQPLWKEALRLRFLSGQAGTKSGS